MRQHTVEKDDAIQHAHKAKIELAVVVKKADRRIDKLQRNVQELQQGKIEMAAHVEQRIESMDLEQRAMFKEKREIQLQQAELVKQKGIQNSQYESLEHQRICNRTERKKLKTTHNKGIEDLKTTHFKVGCMFFSCLCCWLIR